MDDITYGSFISRKINNHDVIQLLISTHDDVDETQTVTLGLNSSEVSTREEELERVQYRYCTDPVVAGVRRTNVMYVLDGDAAHEQNRVCGAVTSRWNGAKRQRISDAEGREKLFIAGL
ncbi:hypothetical protein F2P81_011056 [Scophthalmus maximus]|uniref:Uncharacterized protein n=1 Tax=Scophthalmus maximus TaxID=52904 RepID=A0A6A4SXI4_SCOMX|nr:hypothetical protein F2P81_011056 [Scophthalmus maximus]